MPAASRRRRWRFAARFAAPRCLAARRPVSSASLAGRGVSWRVAPGARRRSRLSAFAARVVCRAPARLCRLRLCGLRAPLGSGHVCGRPCGVMGPLAACLGRCWAGSARVLMLCVPGLGWRVCRPFCGLALARFPSWARVSAVGRPGSFRLPGLWRLLRTSAPPCAFLSGSGPSPRGPPPSVFSRLGLGVAGGSGLAPSSARAADPLPRVCHVVWRGRPHGRPPRAAAWRRAALPPAPREAAALNVASPHCRACTAPSRSLLTACGSLWARPCSGSSRASRALRLPSRCSCSSLSVFRSFDGPAPGRARLLSSPGAVRARGLPCRLSFRAQLSSGALPLPPSCALPRVSGPARPALLFRSWCVAPPFALLSVAVPSRGCSVRLPLPALLFRRRCACFGRSFRGSPARAGSTGRSAVSVFGRAPWRALGLLPRSARPSCGSFRRVLLPCSSQRSVSPPRARPARPAAPRLCRAWPCRRRVASRFPSVCLLRLFRAASAPLWCFAGRGPVWWGVPPPVPCICLCSGFRLRGLCLARICRGRCFRCGDPFFGPRFSAWLPGALRGGFAPSPARLSLRCPLRWRVFSGGRPRCRFWVLVFGRGRVPTPPGGILGPVLVGGWPLALRSGDVAWQAGPGRSWGGSVGPWPCAGWPPACRSGGVGFPGGLPPLLGPSRPGGSFLARPGRAGSLVRRGRVPFSRFLALVFPPLFLPSVCSVPRTSRACVGRELGVVQPCRSCWPRPRVLHPPPACPPRAVLLNSPARTLPRLPPCGRAGCILPRCRGSRRLMFRVSRVPPAPLSLPCGAVAALPPLHDLLDCRVRLSFWPRPLGAVGLRRPFAAFLSRGVSAARPFSGPALLCDALWSCRPWRAFWLLSLPRAGLAVRVFGLICARVFSGSAGCWASCPCAFPASLPRAHCSLPTPLVAPYLRARPLRCLSPVPAGCRLAARLLFASACGVCVFLARSCLAAVVTRLGLGLALGSPFARRCVFVVASLSCSCLFRLAGSLPSTAAASLVRFFFFFSRSSDSPAILPCLSPRRAVRALRGSLLPPGVLPLRRSSVPRSLRVLPRFRSSAFRGFVSSSLAVVGAHPGSTLVLFPPAHLRLCAPVVRLGPSPGVAIRCWHVVVPSFGARAGRSPLLAVPSAGPSPSGRLAGASGLRPPCAGRVLRPVGGRGCSFPPLSFVRSRCPQASVFVFARYCCSASLATAAPRLLFSWAGARVPHAPLPRLGWFFRPCHLRGRFSRSLRGGYCCLSFCCGLLSVLAGRARFGCLLAAGPLCSVLSPAPLAWRRRVPPAVAVGQAAHSRPSFGRVLRIFRAAARSVCAWSGALAAALVVLSFRAAGAVAAGRLPSSARSAAARPPPTRPFGWCLPALGGPAAVWRASPSGSWRGVRLGLVGSFGPCAACWGWPSRRCAGP